MSTASPYADRHRAVAQRFAGLVAEVRDWDAPTPVPEWSARGVVAHLVGWLPGFLDGAGVPVEPGPDVVTDPVAAWRHQSEQVQALLESAHADAEVTHPMLGTMAREVLIDRFYTADVFMHTWDLARSCGLDDTLDPDTAVAMLEGMSAMEDVIRASGQFGTRQPVADDAPAGDRLMAFAGRDPGWRPPGA